MTALAAEPRSSPPRSRRRGTPTRRRRCGRSSWLTHRPWPATVARSVSVSRMPSGEAVRHRQAERRSRSLQLQRPADRRHDSAMRHRDRTSPAIARGQSAPTSIEPQAERMSRSRGVVRREQPALQIEFGKISNSSSPSTQRARPRVERDQVRSGSWRERFSRARRHPWNR